MTASLAADREQDAAVRVVAIANGCIANDLVDSSGFERSRDKRGPHSLVERG
jgi:hypothetical protein